MYIERKWNSIWISRDSTESSYVVLAHLWSGSLICTVHSLSSIYLVPLISQTLSWFTGERWVRLPRWVSVSLRRHMFGQLIIEWLVRNEVCRPWEGNRAKGALRAWGRGHHATEENASSHIFKDKDNFSGRGRGAERVFHKKPGEWHMLQDSVGAREAVTGGGVVGGPGSCSSGYWGTFFFSLQYHSKWISNKYNYYKRIH